MGFAEAEVEPGAGAEVIVVGAATVDLLLATVLVHDLTAVIARGHEVSRHIPGPEAVRLILLLVAPVLDRLIQEAVGLILPALLPGQDLVHRREVTGGEEDDYVT